MPGIAVKNKAETYSAAPWELLRTWEGAGDAVQTRPTLVKCGKERYIIYKFTWERLRYQSERVLFA